MGNRDKPPDAERPTGGARAYRVASRSDDDNPDERGMSSVAMRARKGKREREPERKPIEKEKPADADEKPEQADKADEGEQIIRKGIYLSALIWVEGDWPAPRDFIGPAKAAVREALSKAFEGEHDGLTLRLKRLEVRNDVEEDEEDGEKFEF